MGGKNPEVILDSVNGPILRSDEEDIVLSVRAFLGAMNIVEAIVVSGIDLEDPKNKNKVILLLEEITGAVATQLFLEQCLVGSPQLFAADDNLMRLMENDLKSRVRNSLEAMLTLAQGEYQKLLESDQQPKVVMIAGHQGSGKSIVSEYFLEKGYDLLSMSGPVKEVALAWGEDDKDTVVKIEVGKRLKEVFGDDILVRLGILQARYSEQNLILIDGPRLPNEALAIRDSGILIGVVASNDPDEDRKIRQERILSRTKEDPSRANDAESFAKREEIEGPNIDQILNLANIIIINNGDKDAVFKQLEEYFAS